jgi:hypothetical protein
MTSAKYIGMDVHKQSISILAMNVAGKVVMECVIETQASIILQFIDGVRGDLQVTFAEGTSAACSCGCCLVRVPAPALRRTVSSFACLQTW